MAELKSGSLTFFKFEQPGDTVVGRFADYKPDQPNPFDADKVQNDLVLVTNEETGARTVIHMPVNLHAIVRDNIKSLRESEPTLKVTYTGDQPKETVKKGRKPAKQFKVETIDL